MTPKDSQPYLASHRRSLHVESLVAQAIRPHRPYVYATSSGMYAPCSMWHPDVLLPFLGLFRLALLEMSLGIIKLALIEGKKCGYALLIHAGR